MEIAQAGGRSGKNGPVNPATKLQNGNAIWAMEFSKDGNFLAAGGHDHIVRVWAVISGEEDRNMHEEGASNEGTRTRLSAPVFKPKPVQEYEGHTASVLDLSWSKVSQPYARRSSSKIDIHRTTFFSPRLWTRQCGYGIRRGPSVYVALSTATLLLRFSSIQGMIDSFLQAHWTPSSACGAFPTRASHSGVNFKI